MKELQNIITEVVNSNGRKRPDMDHIIELLKTEEGMFSFLISETRNYYLGAEAGHPSAYIFTDRDWAVEMAKEVAAIAPGRSFRIREITPAERLGFFGDLARSGFTAVTINSGHEALTIPLFAVVRKPEEVEGVIMNPHLVRSLNQFEQAISEHTASEDMQNIAVDLLSTAKLILPCAEDDEKNHPLISNDKGEKYLVVFTDPMELIRFDNKHKFQMKPATMRELRDLAKAFDGIVINPVGVEMICDNEKISRIVNFGSGLKVIK